MKTGILELSGVRLWLARLEEVESEEWPTLYGRMSRERQARCDRYRREADRKRCVLADALARHALAQAAGTEGGALTFARTETGKPYAVGLDKHFSLSHSGALVACAVADFPVGADIQLRRPVTEVLTRRMARAGYRGEREEDFFAWWTCQEAAGKLAGTGLSLRPPEPGLGFRSGVLEEPDGTYFYCVCAEKGAFL